MKLFCKLLLAALLITNVTFAQKNFKDGYIINLKGDTVRGSIDYQEWEYNPAAITFKDASGKITSQTPANTKAFYLKQDGFYQAFSVRLSHDIVSVATPINNLDSAKTLSSVFLRRMLRGKILDLYIYNDAAKKRFVTVEKRNGRPQELTYHYYVFNAIQNSLNGFRNQLLEYAQDYHVLNDKLLDQIQNAEYTEKEIVALVNAINGENALVEKADKKVLKEKAKKEALPKPVDVTLTKTNVVRAFAGAQINSASLTYTGFIDLAENPKSRTIILPQINAGLDFSRDPDVSRLIIRLQLSAFSGQLSAESANAKKTLDMFNFTFSPQVIYNFYIKDPLKIFVGSGFNYNVSSYSNMVYTVTNNKYGIINGQQSLTGEWLSIPLKVGVVLNRRVEIHAGYTFPVDIEGSGPLGYKGTLSSFQGGVNYFFGRK